VEDALGLSGDAIGLIGCLGLLGSLVFGVEAVESLQESVGKAMLVIIVESALSSLIANNVTVGEVLGDDTGTWLFLLSDLVGVLLELTGLFNFFGTLSA
jgi:hypothetical protein